MNFKKILLTLLFSLIIVFSWKISVNAETAEFIDIRELPETTGSYTTQALEQAGEVAKVDFERRYLRRRDGSLVPYFYLDIHHEDGNIYRSKTNLPVTDTADTFTGYYYTEKSGGVVNRFLYYDIKPQNYEPTVLLKDTTMFDYDTQITPFGRVVWNVTTGAYNVVDQMSVYGIIEKRTITGTYDQAYFLDFVLSVPSDSVKMIHLNYSYQNVYWFGIRYGWHDDAFIYSAKDYLGGFEHSGRPIAVHENKIAQLKQKYKNKEYINAAAKISEYCPEDGTINDYYFRQPMISIKNNPEDVGLDSNLNFKNYKTQFVTKLNEQLHAELQMYEADPQFRRADANPVLQGYIQNGAYRLNDIFLADGSNDNIYSLPLRTTIDRLTAIGVEFRNINVIDIVYEKDGQLYHASEQQILSIIPDYYEDPGVAGNLEKFWNDLKQKLSDFWSKNRWFIIGGLIAVVGIFVFIKFGPMLSLIKNNSKQKTPTKKGTSYKKKK